jgi:hypothetical protein
MNDTDKQPLVKIQVGDRLYDLRQLVEDKGQLVNIQIGDKVYDVTKLAEEKPQQPEREPRRVCMSRMMSSQSGRQG